MGSSNENKNENKGIIGKASELIHNTLQTDKDRQVIDEGQKNVLDKAYEDVTSAVKGKTEEPPKSGGGVLEGTREKIYDATKPEDEKKLEENANKNSLDVTTDAVTSVASKVDDVLHAAVLPLEGKDYEDWKERKDKGLLEK